MMYDLATFLPWLLVALAVGGVVGWRSWSNAPRRGWLAGWLLPATLAFAIGLLLAVLNVLPGRAGLWLEIALLMVSAYVFGCVIGGMLKDLLGLDAKAAAPVMRADALAVAADSPAAATPVQSAAAQAAASVEADRLAAEGEAKAEADRLAAEAAAKVEADRLAAEKAETDQLAAEAAAKAEADRLAADAAAMAEADRLAAEAAAKAEADRLAAEAAAKAEADRLAAEAAAKAEADRLAAEAAAKAEADRLAAEAAAKAEADRLAAEAAAKAEADRLAAEAAAKAEADRLAAEAAVKAEADRLAAEAAADAEDDRLAAEVAAAAAPIPDGTADANDRPPALPAAEGTADDLKLIKGIGPKNERILNDIGVHRFSQIAAWSAANASWIGEHMAFPGRIEREHWIAQARLLAAGVDTPHSTAVRSGAITVDDQADAPLSEDESNDLVAQLPALMPKVENEDKHAGARPLGLAAPRGDQADNLKLIKGIGKQNEARLHGLGIWHFAQIAAWTPEHAKWVGSYLAFAGRIEREQWIAQARDLASGGTTEFSRRAEAGLVKSSRDDGSRGQDNVETVQPPE